MDLAEFGYSTFGNRFVIAGGWSDLYDDYGYYIFQYDIEDEAFYKLPEEIHYRAEANVAILTGNILCY